VTRGKTFRSGRRRSTSSGRSTPSLKKWNIRPSMIAIYLLVFVNSVLIISSAHKLFKKSVGVSIQNKNGQEVLTIEVQNGCGVSGIANRFSTSLTAKNYQVIGKGNADHWNYEHTTLIDLDGSKSAAIEKLRKELGIDKEYVYLVREESEADARLIIGKDYQSLKIYSNQQP
jgi:hypothetical protein